MSFKLDISLIHVIRMSVFDTCWTRNTPLRKECPSFIPKPSWALWWTPFCNYILKGLSVFSTTY